MKNNNIQMALVINDEFYKIGDKISFGYTLFEGNNEVTQNEAEIIEIGSECNTNRPLIIVKFSDDKATCPIWKDGLCFYAEEMLGLKHIF